MNTQSAGLKMELEGLKLIKVSLEEKVAKLTRLCDRLGTEVARLEEDLVVANERIAVLEGCRRRDEEEIDRYKIRCAELEEQISHWKRVNFTGTNLEVKSTELFDEVSCQENVGKSLQPVSQKKPNDDAKGLDIPFPTPNQTEQKKLSYQNLVVEVESAGNSPISGSPSQSRERGQTPPVDGIFDSFQIYKAEKIDNLLTTGKGCRVRKSLSFSDNGTMVGSIANDENSFLGEDFILISDDDNGNNDVDTDDDDGKKTDQVLNEGIVQDSGIDDTGETTKGGRNISQTALSIKRPLDQDIEWATQDNTSCCKKDFLSPSTPKKKRKLKVVTSDTEDDADMDHIPAKRIWLDKGDKSIEVIEEAVDSAAIQFDHESTFPSDGDDIEDHGSPRRRRLLPLRKCKKLQETASGTLTGTPNGNQMLLIAKGTLRSGCVDQMHEEDFQKMAKELDFEEGESGNKSESVAVTSGCSDKNKPVTSTKKRFLPLRRCRAKNCQMQGTLNDCSPERNEGTQTGNRGFGTSQTSNKSPERKVSTISSEDDMEEESESDSESLSGFIVDKSSSLGSEHSSEDSADESDTDSGLSQLFNRHNDSNWVDEGQMLSSLGKNPELCMKAVCALYKRQTSEEQSVKGTIYHNKRGFSTIDALRGSQLAEFLMDGDPCGRVTKTLQDLKMYDPSGPELCRNLAFRYSRQLFEIYKAGEDPYFHP
ncbi:hypothetical protein H6P81_014515 [Aristolochia fimbriata]|uniref:Uncharacterized protein n=1 Tax=Aristolochia fimbriata TaxID=158543 RepID=A0AAV7EHT1_ARIFI|nr:hypothetical protein H6P81_014515 [Aristolochia fimbriata]